MHFLLHTIKEGVLKPIFQLAWERKGLAYCEQCQHLCIYIPNVIMYFLECLARVLSLDFLIISNQWPLGIPMFLEPMGMMNYAITE